VFICHNLKYIPSLLIGESNKEKNLEEYVKNIQEEKILLYKEKWSGIYNKLIRVV
jgi:hypothetical protein